jgi:N-acetylneuraminic acid mutarotase
MEGDAGPQSSKVHSAFPERVWRRRQPLAEGSVFAATVVGPDERIYVITGSIGDTGQLTSRNSAYTPLRDTWTRLAPIPTPRSEPGAALGPNGQIYVIGGNPTLSRKHSSMMNVVEVYDTALDRWTRCKSMPTPRTALCAVAATNAAGRLLIYAMGGRNFDLPGNGLSVVEAYDALDDTWTPKASMPINLHAMTATLGMDGKIYVLGGTNSKMDDVNTVQTYDPKTDHWTQPTVMPYGQECACSTFIPGENGEIVVFGGWGNLKKEALGCVAVYNPRTDSWSSLPALPTPTAAAGAATIKTTDGLTRLYVIGGLPNPTVVQEYLFRAAF